MSATDLEKVVAEIALLYHEVVEKAKELTDIQEISRIYDKVANFEASLLVIPRTEEVDECFCKLTEIRAYLMAGGQKLSLGTVIDLSKVEKLKFLGKGQFGEVYKAKIGSTLFAVKDIINPNAKRRRMFLNEAKMMSKIQHPNLLRYFGAVQNPDDTISLVCELCSSDLEHAMIKNKAYDPAFVSNVLKWFCQAASGLTWLHENCRMIHHDLKPANILILPNGDAVVADFGLTKFLPRTSSGFKYPGGSPLYFAPEIFNEKPFNTSVDVFAFALSMFQVLLGAGPYRNDIKTESQLIAFLNAGGRPDFNRFTENGRPLPPQRLITLLQQCWQQLPSLRPTMKEVCETLKDIFIESHVYERPSSIPIPSVVLPPPPPESIPVVNLLVGTEPIVGPNPAISFWKKHFREMITDRVDVEGAIAAFPECERIFASLANRGMLYLKDLINLAYWYGDWTDADNLSVIGALMTSAPWFFGPPYGEDRLKHWRIDAEHAAAIISYYYDKDKRSQFLVRCSERNPRQSPFTLTLCDDQGHISHHRIHRNAENQLSCPEITPKGESTIFAPNLLTLIQDLQDDGQLNASPVDGYPDAVGLY